MGHVSRILKLYKHFQANTNFKNPLTSLLYSKIRPPNGWRMVNGRYNLRSSNFLDLTDTSGTNHPKPPKKQTGFKKPEAVMDHSEIQSTSGAQTGGTNDDNNREQLNLDNRVVDLVMAGDINIVQTGDGISPIGTVPLVDEQSALAAINSQIADLRAKKITGPNAMDTDEDADGNQPRLGPDGQPIAQDPPPAPIAPIVAADPPAPVIPPAAGVQPAAPAQQQQAGGSGVNMSDGSMWDKSQNAPLAQSSGVGNQLAVVDDAPPAPGIPMSGLTRPVIPERAPVSAPIEVDENARGKPIDFWRAGGKLGDASVTPVNVVPIRPLAYPSVGQNILAGLQPLINGRQERVQLGQGNIVISGVVALPFKGLGVPMAQLNVTYTRMMGVLAPRNTEIQMDDAIPISEVDSAVRKVYMSNGQLDAKMVANTMRATVNMSNLFSSAAAPMLLLGHNQYDLSGLYCLMFIMEDYSATLDEFNIDRNVGPLYDAAITSCNLAAAAGDAPDMIERAASAIQEGRLSVRRCYMTEGDRRAMDAITAGPAAIAVLDNVNHVVHRTFTWPNNQVLWFIWETHDPQVPQQGVATTQDIRAFIGKTVGWFDAQHDMVRGFMRAQTILNGMAHVNGDQTKTWFTSLFEAETLSIPRPRGTNFLWRMLTTKTEPFGAFEDLSAEYAVLNSLNFGERRKLGAVVASVLSLAMSSVFNDSNLNGRDTNNWIRRQPVAVTDHLDTLMTRRLGGYTPAIFNAMCHVATQFTGFAVASSSFRSRGWCACWPTGRDVGQDLWQGRFGMHSPYFLRPEALEWVMAQWLTVWGISSVGLKYDISNDMFNVGPQDGQGLMVYMGDVKYREAAISDNRCKYNPYGIMLINGIKQNWRWDNAFAVSYRWITQSRTNQVLIDPVYHVEQAWQPNYDPATFTAYPGTLMTYDWSRDVILAPAIMRDQFGNNWEGLTHNLSCDSGYAGYSNIAAPVYHRVERAPINFASMYFGAGGPPPQIEAQPRTSERKENLNGP